MVSTSHFQIFTFPSYQLQLHLIIVCILFNFQQCTQCLSVFLESALCLFQSSYALALPPLPAQPLALDRPSIIYTFFLSKRTINGFNIADVLGYAAVIVLVDVGGWLYPCGGTLISKRHVITAAHCVIKFKVIVFKDNISIGLGHYNWDYHRFIKSTIVTVRPNYIPSRSDGEYDIAIVETNNVVFNQYSNRVPIYDGPLGANQNMLAIGWGVPSLEDQTMNTLLKSILTMSGNKTLCKGYIDNFVDNNGPQIYSPRVITLYHGSCMGDSGSALLVNYKFIALGVTSIATNASEEDQERGNPYSSSFGIHIAYYVGFVFKTMGLSREYPTGLTETME